MQQTQSLFKKKYFNKYIIIHKYIYIYFFSFIFSPNYL